MMTLKSSSEFPVEFFQTVKSDENESIKKVMDTDLIKLISKHVGLE